MASGSVTKRQWLAAIAVLCLGALLGRFVAIDPPKYSTLPITVSFELHDQNNQIVRASDLRGQTLLVFFGYTHCPDICPTTLSTIREVREALGDTDPNFRGVFITVDPARDDPARLKTYVEHFDTQILGLGGTDEQIERAAQSFGAVYERGESIAGGGYLMGHTAFGYVVDPAGEVAEVFAQGTPTADYVARIRLLLPPGNLKSK
ncbi:MAG: SCO family protein [Chromatiales bacterium]|nr:SCO family protein [Chromatiales bacterium]